MKKPRIYLILSAALALLFTVFTVCTATVDVRADGFEGSKIGFASLNRAVCESVGKSDYFNTSSDAFLTLSVIAATVFAVCGLVQWIKRKKLRNIDAEILILGAVYLLIAAVYGVFETVIVNYRPAAEASYPSTHTYVVMTVALTAAIYAKRKIKDKMIFGAVCVICVSVSALTALCRLCSGEHWITDIIGGLLAGGALTSLYAGLSALSDHKKKKTEDKGD